MQNPIQNQLGSIRRSRGVGAADLARRVGVSRQAIYAIESGSYMPNTEVSLKLARELEVTVEEMFSLSGEQPKAPKAPKAPELLTCDVLSARVPPEGQPMRICRVGNRWVSIPAIARPYFLPDADGVVSLIDDERYEADLLVFSKGEAEEKKLVLAGCDPAIHLVCRAAERLSGVEVVPAAASSRLALEWLKAGKVHIAGLHLKDADSGEFNLPFIRELFPDEACTVVTFAHWEEGIVTARGNPKGIRTTGDFAKKGVRLVNREPGSGSRDLLDRMLEGRGLPPDKVDGYDRVAYGHLAAAYAVISGEADCCLATSSAAMAFGLEFIPIEGERYDLVMRRATLEIPAAQMFLDVLQRGSLRKKLEVLAGYDTAETGSVLV